MSQGMLIRFSAPMPLEAKESPLPDRAEPKNYHSLHRGRQAKRSTNSNGARSSPLPMVPHQSSRSSPPSNCMMMVIRSEMPTFSDAWPVTLRLTTEDNTVLRKKDKGMMIFTEKAIHFGTTEEEAKTAPGWELSYYNVYAKNATKQGTGKPAMLRLVDKDKNTALFTFVADDDKCWEDMNAAVELTTVYLSKEYIDKLKSDEEAVEVKPEPDSSEVQEALAKKEREEEPAGLAVDDASRLLSLAAEEHLLAPTVGPVHHDVTTNPDFPSLKETAFELDADLKILYGVLVESTRALTEVEFWSLHSSALASASFQSKLTISSDRLTPIDLAHMKSYRDSAERVGGQVMPEEEKVANQIVSRVPELALVYSNVVPAHMDRGAFMRRLLRSRAVYLIEGLTPPAYAEPDRLFDGLLVDIANRSANRLSVSGPQVEATKDVGAKDKKLREATGSALLSAVRAEFGDSAADSLKRKATALSDPRAVLEMARDSLFRVDDEEQLGNASHTKRRRVITEKGGILEDELRGPSIAPPGTISASKARAGVRGANPGTFTFAAAGDASTGLLTATILASRLNSSAAEELSCKEHLPPSGAPPRWQEALAEAKKFGVGTGLGRVEGAATMQGADVDMSARDANRELVAHLPDPGQVYSAALRELVDIPDLRGEVAPLVSELQVDERKILKPISETTMASGVVPPDVGLSIGGGSRDTLSRFQKMIEVGVQQAGGIAGEAAEAHARSRRRDILARACSTSNLVARESFTMNDLSLSDSRGGLRLASDLHQTLTSHLALIRETAGHFWRCSLQDEDRHKREALLGLLDHFGQQLAADSRVTQDTEDGANAKNCLQTMVAMCGSATRFNETLVHMGLLPPSGS